MTKAAKKKGRTTIQSAVLKRTRKLAREIGNGAFGVRDSFDTLLFKEALRGIEADAHSPVLALVKHVVRHVAGVGTWSRELRRSAMTGALELAFDSRMHFQLDDFEALADISWGSGYYTHSFMGKPADEEGWYTKAIETHNRSAAISLEKWANRKPFMFNLFYSGGIHRVTPTRLAVRSEFVWENSRVTVTSFAEDGNSLIACAYHPPLEGGLGKGPVKRRYRLTIADLRADMAARRNAIKGDK